MVDLRGAAALSLEHWLFGMSSPQKHPAIRCRAGV
jgi:hypothetical protein